MGLFGSMGIARRLWTVVIVLSLALASVAGYAYVQLGHVADAARRAEQSRVPQLAEAASMELNITRASLQLRHAMLARTPAERQASVDDISVKRRLVSDSIAIYAKGLYTERGTRMFEKLPPMMAKFWQVADENLALILDGKIDDAFAFLVDKTIPLRNELLAMLDGMVQYQRVALTSDVDEIGKEIKSTIMVLVSLVVVAIAGLLLSSAYVARTLRSRVALSQSVAERARDGDLTTPIPSGSIDEFTPLLEALRAMQASLSTIVSGVRHNAESVASASAQIAQGNLDLSSRTESQAGALQETAATMEELGQTVRHNADNAQQANQLALSASGVAVKGGDVMGQVIGTMRDIHESSRRIADIIGVIDSIAFQTNILALNAAVEAARAGEQGRGFAVVASEVRSLAKRAADAAHEIKSLITASVSRIDQGTALVDNAGATMKEIVDAIQRVNTIVGEISSSSREQSAGVGEVAVAVTQMDRTTQQNAALVEESAAAADSLRNQAAELVKAVAVFRIG